MEYTRNLERTSSYSYCSSANVDNITVNLLPLLCFFPHKSCSSSHVYMSRIANNSASTSITRCLCIHGKYLLISSHTFAPEIPTVRDIKTDAFIQTQCSQMRPGRDRKKSALAIMNHMICFYKLLTLHDITPIEELFPFCCC